MNPALFIVCLAVVGAAACAARIPHCRSAATFFRTPRVLVSREPETPTGEELACFIRRTQARCIEFDLSSLPSGRQLGDRQVCWAVPHAEGLCARGSLEELFSDCPIAELGVVAAWEGPCDTLPARYQLALASGAAPGALARYLLYVNALGLVVLSAERESELMRTAQSEPEAEELLLSYISAGCQRGLNNPLVGDVVIDSSTQIEWIVQR